jgi:hypothetical protein
MNSFLRPVWGTPPDFVNEIGVKWWRDLDTTKYAIREDSFGTTLDVAVWFIEEANGRRTRLIVQDGRAIYDDQSLEGIAVRIDALKLLKREDERENGYDPAAGLPFKKGAKVRFTEAWLSQQPEVLRKRFANRVGEVTGYRVRTTRPNVLFPKEGRRIEQMRYEVIADDIEAV